VVWRSGASGCRTPVQARLRQRSVSVARTTFIAADCRIGRERVSSELAFVARFAATAPMRDLLTLLTRHAAAVLAVGVFAGLLMPDAAAWLRPALPASVAGLLFLALLRIDWAEFAVHLTRPRRAVGVVAWVLLASPLLALMLTAALPLPAALAAAIVLMAASPPIMSGPAIALLVGLDAPLALVLMVIASLVAPFTLPALPWLVPALDIDVRPLLLLARLVALIGGCCAAAIAVRRMVGAARLARVRGTLDLGSVVLLLLFAVAVMDGMGPRIGAAPGTALLYVVAAFVANLVLQCTGGLLFASAGRRTALTVAFASGNRNMALLLAVLPRDSAPDLLLFFALGQFPIYLLPALMVPLYRRLLVARDG